MRGKRHKNLTASRGFWCAKTGLGDFRYEKNNYKTNKNIFTLAYIKAQVCNMVCSKAGIRDLFQQYFTQEEMSFSTWAVLCAREQCRVYEANLRKMCMQQFLSSSWLQF